MPPDLAALLPAVLTGAAVLFVIAYLGNLLSFSNRFTNALVTALLFGAIYGAILYVADTSALQVNRHVLPQIVIMSAVIVFVIDLVANTLSFSNRLVSALVTAVVFAVFFGIAFYAAGGLPTMPTSPTPT